MRSSQSGIYFLTVKYEPVTKDCQVFTESILHKKREIKINKKKKEAELEAMSNLRKKMIFKRTLGNPKWQWTK